MIFLIGGSPRSGKTILAKRLSQERSIPWLSIDSIRPVIKPYLPTTEGLPFESMWKEQDNDRLFQAYSPEELIEAGRKEAITLWPGVREFLIHNYLISQDYVIEGEQLLPELVWTLHAEKWWQRLQIMYLVHLDREKTLAGIKQNTGEHDWLTLHSKKESTLVNAAQMICLSGQAIQTQAKAYGLPVITMDDDFPRQIDIALRSMKY